LIELTAVPPRSTPQEGEAVRADSETLLQSRFASYLSDESGFGPGHAQTIFFPTTEKQVADFLREMNFSKIPITVSGGRTGIVGGAVPEGGAILSLDRMNRIVSIRLDRQSGEWRIQVEPGIRLKELQARLATKNLTDSPVSASDPNWKDLPGFQEDARQYFYAPDPTEDSASLGGTVATDASGARTYHFGRTRKHIRAIRIVLANGIILEIRRGVNLVDSSRTVRIRSLENAETLFQVPSYESPHLKSAAGYLCQKNMDLIDLFIGSEGTLGVITLIEIALTAAPKQSAMFLAFFPSETKAVGFAGRIRSSKTADAHLTVYSLEYLDSNSLRLLRRMKQEGKLKLGVTLPDSEFGAAILGEFAYEDLTDAIQFLNPPLQEFGSTLDKTISATDAKGKEQLRDMRHAVPEAINEIVAQRKTQVPGMHKLGTDTAVPDGKLELMLASYSRMLKMSGLEHYVIGHVAENHLHVNLLPTSAEELSKGEELIQELAMEAVKLGGTVSAEHGIGKMKKPLLQIMFSGNEINQMLETKRALDPNLILGRGNIFQI
jgi:D-lactate dehydrogenase (cytochrome)